MISNVGRLAYNGLTFGPYVRSSISTVMVEDEAQRTVIGCRITISVRAWVQSDSGTDLGMTDILTRLSKNGGTLYYDNGRGFGGPFGTGLAVNVPGGAVQDSDWGPKPKLIDFVPLGGGNCALVTWRVTTMIPLCQANATFKGQIMAFNYDQSWTQMDDGRLEIDTAGYLEIPITWLAAGRSVPDDADSYRDKIKSPVPRGFRRYSPRYHISKNRRRLDFSWRDVELDSPLPNNCVEADIRHSVSWQISNAALMVNHISAELTAAQDVDKSVVLDRFKAIVASRMQTQARKGAMLVGVGKQSKFQGGALAGAGGGAAGAAANLGKFVGAIGMGLAAEKQACSVLLTNLTISENVLHRSCSFGVTYNLIGSNLPVLMQASGLFNKIEGLDFDAWAGTMSATIHSDRGWAKGKFDRGSDFIVDLCIRSKAPVQTDTDQEGKKQQLAEIELAKKLGMVEEPQVLAPQAVNPEKSWVAYQCYTAFVEDDRVIRHKPLTGAPKTQDTSQNKPSNPSQAMLADSDVGAKSSVPDVIQRLSAPSYDIALRGRAIRLGHRVPTPRLVEAGGQKVTQAEDYSSEGVLTACCGIPLWYKDFDVRYILKQAPNANVPVAGNPALMVPDNFA